MCEEIRDELIRCSTPRINWLKEYSLFEIKEKYGILCWYDNGTPIGSVINDIISKYEDRSGMICINCGKPAKYMTRGWVSYVCKSCYMKNLKKIISYRQNHTDIKMDNKEFIKTSLIRDKLYNDNIPYRTIYKTDGSKTVIESPYLEEMKKLWPDEKPEILKQK